MPEMMENCNKEKKQKRRHSNRRRKQIASMTGPSGSDTLEKSSKWPLDCRTSNSTLFTLQSSIPNKLIGDNLASSRTEYTSASKDQDMSPLEFSDMQDHLFLSRIERMLGEINSETCSEPPSHVEKVTISPHEDMPLSHKNGYSKSSKYFSPYWAEHALGQALEKGHAFRALFRVNAHNRLEAYCTLDGVPTDVLINGVAAQNRAVEGDVVAIVLDSISSWTRMKGSVIHPDSSIIENDTTISEITSSHCKSKDRVNANDDNSLSKKSPLLSNQNDQETNSSNEFFHLGESKLEKLCEIIKLFPLKRPTGRVVAILENSPRRSAVIGYLDVKQWFSYQACCKMGSGEHSSIKGKNAVSFSSREHFQFAPTDARFPKMKVNIRNLPDSLQERLKLNDASVEMELVSACIKEWTEESLLPEAHVVHSFGCGLDIGPQIAAILHGYSICTADFSQESLDCLPSFPWNIPAEELNKRKDLRKLCTFTIDPASATDLDDALSIERISNDIQRVGVHIADVSYFVQPGTSLDIEAQTRSTTVYMLQRKLPMLPSELSDYFASLNPGVDRFCVSIMWDINSYGEIVDQWIDRSIIRSCCKLSYENAQDIINGSLDFQSLSSSENVCPKLQCEFKWKDLVTSIRNLHEISKKLKENRLKDGALWLENSKLTFLFDELGMPYDSILCERMESNFLVEEFMLLANKTVAGIIAKAFPACALLRRHPKPKSRKLKEFEMFCKKHGFELDILSSGQLQSSLSKIKEELKDDPVLFDILVSYATKPMESASYFCTGNSKCKECDCSHYSLSIPFYTHFTSPLRRYPDIIVHRTMSAVLEAEEKLLRARSNSARKYFTGLLFDSHIAESKEGKEALENASALHKVPGSEALVQASAYCNERKLASRHAEEAGDRVYMWAMLKKKEILISHARVLGLGPKFMSIYIQKLAIERRIYYDEVEGLMVEWLETTSTLVLDLRVRKYLHKQRENLRKHRPLHDVTFIISSCDQDILEEDASCIYKTNLEPSPAIFPLTLQLLSTIPVVLHAVGGNGCATDIVAKLYLSSYFK